MHPMKRLLLTHRPVFVLGLVQPERYEWFRGLTDPLFRSYVPSGDMDHDLDIPLFFFPGKVPSGYVEYGSGEWEQLPLSGPFESHSITAMYFSVPDHLLPGGFVFILPPAFGISFEFELAAKLMFQDGIWFRRDARLIWVDSFPYGQYDGLQTLDNLRKELSYPDTSVCLLKTGRRFAYSDISGEAAAIHSAEQEWRSCSERTIVVEPGAERQMFTSLLYAGRSYTDPIQVQVKNDMQQKQSYIRKHFREDYDFMVLKRVTPDLLEPIFAYEKWQRSSSGLIQEWNEQMRKLVLPSLNTELMGFVEYQLSGTEIYSLDEPMKKLINKLWKDGFAYINACFPKHEPVEKGLDKVAFMAEIKLHKVKYLEALNHVMEEIAGNALEQFIERHFNLWNKLA